MSLLFGVCVLTRLSGFLLRVLLGVDGMVWVFIRRWKPKAFDALGALGFPWTSLGAFLELTIALLGSIYLLDSMRFALLNFTTSFGEEGEVLPGELTVALYAGLFGSLAMLQSSTVQVPQMAAVNKLRNTFGKLCCFLNQSPPLLPHRLIHCRPARASPTKTNMFLEFQSPRASSLQRCSGCNSNMCNKYRNTCNKCHR